VPKSKYKITLTFFFFTSTVGFSRILLNFYCLSEKKKTKIKQTLVKKNAGMIKVLW